MKTLALALILVLVIAGCTAQTFDATGLAKNSAAVKQFLADYPDAKILATIVSSAPVGDYCKNPELLTKDYWKVTVEDQPSNTIVTAWLDAENNQVVCVVKDNIIVEATPTAKQTVGQTSQPAQQPVQQPAQPAPAPVPTSTGSRAAESATIAEGQSKILNGYNVTVESVAASGTARASISVCEATITSITTSATVIKEGESTNLGGYTVTVDSVAASGTAKAALTVTNANGDKSDSTTINEGASQTVYVGKEKVTVEVTNVTLGRAAQVKINAKQSCSGAITFNEGDTKNVPLGSTTVVVQVTSVTLGRAATVSVG